MENEMKRVLLETGIAMNWLQDSRYKENRLSVHLLTPLSREYVTENALLAGVLEKGSQKYPEMADVANRFADLYGAYFSVSAGKSGPWQDVVLSITSMEESYAFSKTPLLRDCAEFLLDTLLSPKMEGVGFSQKDVEVEKKALLEDIASDINNKRFYARKKCIEILLEGEVYALPRTGFAEDLPEITAESLHNQYSALLRHARIEIFGVGTDDFETLFPLFKEAFSKIKREPVLEILLPERSVQKGSVKLQTDRMDVSQTKLVLGFNTGKAENLREELAMRLFTSIYGGSPNSKLFLHVREELGLCYYCSASYDYYASVLLVDSGTDDAEKEKASAAVLEQLDAMKSGSFTENDLMVAKKEMADGFRGVYDEPGRVEGFFLGGLLSGLGGTPENRRALMEDISADEITQVAEKIQLSAIYTLTKEEE